MRGNQPVMRARQTQEEEGTIRRTEEERTPQQQANDWLSGVADENDDVKDIVMQELMGREDFQNA
jgi:phosphohistidine phosphatase SixA